MTRHLPTLAALCLLAGCPTNSSNTQAIAATETALTAAERAALVYKRLPACPQPAGAMCSDPAVVSKILAADNVAYAAVVDLRAGKVTPAAAAALIAQLVVLVPVK